MISHNLCPFREPTHEVVGACGPHAYAVRVLPAHFGLRRSGGGGPARRAELCSCASSGDCVSDQCTPHAAGRAGSGTWRRERCPAIVAKPLGCCTAGAGRAAGSAHTASVRRAFKPAHAATEIHNRRRWKGGMHGRRRLSVERMKMYGARHVQGREAGPGIPRCAGKGAGAHLVVPA